MGFICAKWIRLDDGCVARCDKDHTHQDRHLDSIIDICWPDNDPRMQANMPATTAAELVKSCAKHDSLNLQEQSSSATTR